MKVSAIVAAAGQGRRMQANKNKQYLQLDNEMILSRTLKVLDRIEEIKEIVVVVGSSEIEFCQEEIIDNNNLRTQHKVVAGGKERQDSVRAGLAALSCDSEYILIHDGARPLITKDLIGEALIGAREHNTAVLAVPVKDTIKVVDRSGYVVETPDRSKLRAVQTPQIFKRDLICDAYQWAIEADFSGTDDASLVEAMGEKVYLVQGSYENIKITTPEDLLLAKEIIRRRSECE